MWFGATRSGYIQRARSITDPSPAARLMDHFSDYRFSYFYGIQRTQNLSAALSAVAEAVSCPELKAYRKGVCGIELGIEICGAALGGLTNSSDVLLLKSSGDLSLNSERQSSKEWLEDPNAQSAVRAWRYILSQHLATHLNMSVGEADAAIEEALMAFCIQANQKQTFEGEMRRRLQESIREASDILRPHRHLYWGLRGIFRLMMRIVGRPRPNRVDILKLDRCDALDVQDVITTLDESGR